jgi:GxxExxY protein
MVTTAAGRGLLDADLTEQVIGGYFAVYNTLKPGLLETVYRRAMITELSHRGLDAATEVPFEVRYRGQIVGDYRADLVVEGRLIVECKAVDRLLRTHEAQLINYLHIAHLPLGLLLNFGPAAAVRRLTRSSPKQSIPADPVDPENP